MKMKHLVLEPRDVTLSKRGLGRLPRGNGRVPGVGEPNKLLLPTPPPPSQPDRAAWKASEAVEHQCPLVAMVAPVVWKIGWEGAPDWAFNTKRDRCDEEPL